MVKTDKEGEYGTPQLCAAERLLLLMAGLPLVDGVFIGAFADRGSAISSLAAAVGFGLLVFGGAGCIAAAASLDGSMPARLWAVTRVYLLVALGALVAMLILPLVRAVVLPDFVLFSTLVLVGVSLQMLGLRAVPDGAPPSSVWGTWVWCLRLAAMPQAVLAIALCVSVVHVFREGFEMEDMVSGYEVMLGLAAVGTGYAETVLGLLLALVLGRFLDPVWMRRGGAAGLILVAASILGMPLHPVVPFALLGVGVAVGAITRVASVSRGCTELDASGTS